MSDVSKTNEQITEAAGRLRKYYEAGEVIHMASSYRTCDGVTHIIDFEDLRTVVEAATRVPVQGEPNDDQEALRDEFRSYLGDEIYVCSRDYSAWSHGTMGFDDFSLASEDDEVIESLVQIASRATVPDAATEGRIERWRQLVGKGVEKRMAAEAERDAALAAVDRVRAVHVDREHRTLDGTYLGGTVCDGCRRPYPCPTVAALDGAPEPDPYDDFCPTCDAPNPWHTDTCAVPFRGSRSALAGAPEPEWEVQYGRRNRETGALHWLTGDPRDDWWHENQDRYEHVKRYTSPPLPVEGESKP